MFVYPRNVLMDIVKHIQKWLGQQIIQSYFLGIMSHTFLLMDQYTIHLSNLSYIKRCHYRQKIQEDKWLHTYQWFNQPKNLQGWYILFHRPWCHYFQKGHPDIFQRIFFYYMFMFHQYRHMFSSEY